MMFAPAKGMPRVSGYRTSGIGLAEIQGSTLDTTMDTTDETKTTLAQRRNVQ
jgi:hypothetical protein